MAVKALPPKFLLQHSVLLLLAWPIVAFAQATYPTKPIRWIVPFVPGGSTTIIARLLGQKLTESWGPAIIDLMGGQIQLFTNNAVPLIPFVKSGKIRAIAVSGETRLRSLPDVPTFTQAGLPGFEVKSWQGILAPAKTPKPIIDKLSQEFARILQTPEIRETLLTMGADPLIGTPQQFAALIKVDLVRYAKLIKAANIKLD